MKFCLNLEIKSDEVNAILICSSDDLFPSLWYCVYTEKVKWVTLSQHIQENKED